MTGRVHRLMADGHECNDGQDIILDIIKEIASMDALNCDVQFSVYWVFPKSLRMFIR